MVSCLKRMEGADVKATGRVLLFLQEPTVGPSMLMQFRGCEHSVPQLSVLQEGNGTWFWSSVAFLGSGSDPSSSLLHITSCPFFLLLVVLLAAKENNQTSPQVDSSVLAGVISHDEPRVRMGWFFFRVTSLPDQVSGYVSVVLLQTQ